MYKIYEELGPLTEEDLKPIAVLFEETQIVYHRKNWYRNFAAKRMKKVLLQPRLDEFKVFLSEMYNMDLTPYNGIWISSMLGRDTNDA